MENEFLIRRKYEKLTNKYGITAHVNAYLSSNIYTYMCM